MAAPIDFPTGNTRTLSLSFRVQASGRHGAVTAAGAFAEIRCDAGLLFFLEASGGHWVSDPRYLAQSVTYNGNTIYSDIAIRGDYAWAIDQTHTCTIQLEEWCEWDGAETFTYYERLAADPPDLPFSGAFGFARKGDKVTTTAQPGYSPNPGIMTYVMQWSYVPTFVVTLSANCTCEPNWGPSNASAQIVGTPPWDVPPDPPVSGTFNPTTGGSGSGTVGFTSVSGVASGGGATENVGGGGYVTYSPAFSPSIEGDLWLYDIGDAWDGPAYTLDGVAQSYYEYGFPGDPPLPAWPAPVPGPLPKPVNGSGSAGGTQFYWERSYSGTVLQCKYTFSPMMVGWDTSQTKDGSGFSAIYPLVAAPAYAVWQMKHNPAYVVDDCSAVSRWGISAGTLAQQTAGTIRADASPTANTTLSSFHGSRDPDVSSWRYLDITFRRLNAVTTGLKFRRPILVSSGNTVLSAVAEWDVAVGDLNAWTTTRLDLLCPARILRTDQMPGQNPPATRLFDDTQLPQQVDGGLFGPWLWQPTITLPAGGSWEFDQFAMGMADAAGVKQGVFDSTLWAFGDEKTLLWLQTSGNLKPSGLPYSLDDLKALISDNNGYDASHGWSVIPPPGGYPTTHPVYNMSAPATWIGGRTGFVHRGGEWVSYVERPETAEEDSNGIVHYAQPCVKYVWLYPGVAAPETNPVRFQARLGTRCYGHVWNLGQPAGSAQIDFYRYFTGGTPPAAPSKSITLSSGAYYSGLLNFGTVTDAWGRVRPQGPFVPPGIRTKLSQALGKPYTPPLDTGLFGHVGPPRHTSFWIDVEGGGNPWLLEDGWGRLHVSGVMLGKGVVYSRSDSSVPLPDWAIHQALVTPYDTDGNPRMALDYRGCLYLTFDRPQDATDADGPRDAWIARSDDDGASWSDPTLMITGGKNPTIAAGEDGTLIAAALVGGVLNARIRKPGDADFGDTLVFTDGTNPIEAANDTFHLAQAAEGPARWALAVMVSGDDGPSVWMSADDAPDDGQSTMSWKRVG